MGGVIPITCIQPTTGTGGLFILAAFDGGTVVLKMVQIQFLASSDSTISVKAVAAKYAYKASFSSRWNSADVNCNEASINSMWNSANAGVVATFATASGYGIHQLTIAAAGPGPEHHSFSMWLVRDTPC